MKELVDADRNDVDVLAEEFAERLRRGEMPSIDEYIEQYPDLHDEIHELFPTIAALEGLRRKKERPTDGLASMGPAKLDRLGDFRILREIGRGGMGVVYEAEQESLRRRVAVKVLPKQSLLEDKHLRRFQREARTAARLHHTNIVPILAVGVHDGFHYYAMQIIDGVGLDQIIGRMAEHEHDELSAHRLSQLWRKFRADSLRDTWEDGDTSQTAVVGSSAQLDALADAPSLAAAISEITKETIEAKLADATGSKAGHVEDIRNAPTGQLGNALDPESTDISVDLPSPSGAMPAPSFATGESDSAVTPPPPSSSPTQPSSYWHNIALIGVQAASALDYAHQHGVLHRDIKPGNLILDESGTVWVADFGLAKASEQDAVSRTGDIVGTLRFMAPEQLRGEADTRSDVYALGVTLYELLTLQPAHRESVRKKALVSGGASAPVVGPRKINRSIPRDLETIILKAMAEDPAHRYQSARQLEEDLQRFIEDRTILARRANPAERLTRWSRRNPAMAALSTLAALLLIMVAVIASVGYVRTQNALTKESLQRERVEAAVSVSLDALDRVYQRFAPDRVLVASNVSVGESIEDGDEGIVELPSRPELSPETAALLKDLLSSYDKLAALNTTDVNLQAEVAKANRRLGDIYHRLDQVDDALFAYHDAIELTKKLTKVVKDPQQLVNLEKEYARIHNDVGAIYQRLGQHSAAVQTFHTSLNTLKNLVKTTKTPEIRFELARTHFLLAGGTFGNVPMGLTVPRSTSSSSNGPRTRSRSNTPRSPERAKSDPSEQQPFSRPRPRTGPPTNRKEPVRSLMFRHIDDSQQTHLESAVTLLSELKLEHPGVPEYPRMLALCYREKFRGGDRPAIELATEVLTRLVNDYPRAEDYRYDLALTIAASSLLECDQLEGTLRAAVDHVRQLDPYTPAYAVARAELCSALANAIFDILEYGGESDGDLDEVQLLFEEAVEIQASLVAKSPNVDSYRARAANSMQALARLLLHRDTEPETLRRAESLLHQSSDQLESLLEKAATNPMFHGLHWPVAKIYEQRASIFKQLSMPDQAQATTDQAKAHWKAWASQFRGGSRRRGGPPSNGPRKSRPQMDPSMEDEKTPPTNDESVEDGIILEDDPC